MIIKNDKNFFLPFFHPYFPPNRIHISAQFIGLVLTSSISCAIFFFIWIAFNCLLNCLKMSFLISKSSTPLWAKVQSFSKHLKPNLQGNLREGLNSAISFTCSSEVWMMSDNNCLSDLTWWWTQRQLSSIQKELK